MKRALSGSSRKIISSKPSTAIQEFSLHLGSRIEESREAKLRIAEVRRQAEEGRIREEEERGKEARKEKMRRMQKQPLMKVT